MSLSIRGSTSSGRRVNTAIQKMASYGPRDAIESDVGLRKQMSGSGGNRRQALSFARLIPAPTMVAAGITRLRLSTSSPAEQPNDRILDGLCPRELRLRR